MNIDEMIEVLQAFKDGKKILVLNREGKFVGINKDFLSWNFGDNTYRVKPEPREFYARKLSDNIEGFENLKITLKIVHKTEGSEKYEVHANLIINGKPITSEITDRNLFVALDEVLKKVESLAGK